MNSSQPQGGQIITDPQKLTNQIKRSGIVGIIFGVLLIVIGLLEVIISQDIGALILYFILGAIYIILGLTIRMKPQVSKTVIIITLGYSVILGLLSVVEGKAPGIFLLLYIWMLTDSLKFVKRLNQPAYGLASPPPPPPNHLSPI
jgi:hypothetical protein